MKYFINSGKCFKISDEYTNIKSFIQHNGYVFCMGAFYIKIKDIVCKD